MLVLNDDIIVTPWFLLHFLWYFDGALNWRSKPSLVSKRSMFAKPPFRGLRIQNGQTHLVDDVALNNLVK